ncbi:MAG: hypothetical protein RBT63_06615, partial [Bdellovibrionales bacterium]|nr:hypothetical protein [Bdellovibrionales bacterium]
MPTQTLSPSRTKLLSITIPFLAVALYGAYLFFIEGIALYHGYPVGTVAVVSLVISLIPGIQLLPGSTFLRLDETGFTARSLFRSYSY